MPRWLSIYMVSPLPGNPPWYLSLLGLGQFDLQGLDLHIVVETILLVPALVLKSTSGGGCLDGRSPVSLLAFSLYGLVTYMVRWLRSLSWFSLAFSLLGSSLVASPLGRALFPVCSPTLSELRRPWASPHQWANQHHLGYLLNYAVIRASSSSRRGPALMHDRAEEYTVRTRGR